MEIYRKPYLLLKLWHLIFLQEERKGGLLVQFQGPQEQILLSQSYTLPWTGSSPVLLSSPTTYCQDVQARYPTPARYPTAACAVRVHWGEILRNRTEVITFSVSMSMEWVMSLTLIVKYTSNLYWYAGSIKHGFANGLAINGSDNAYSNAAQQLPV